MGFEELNGAEIDVLYKLYHYGSQEDGNLPSKAGMSGLIGKGLAVKDYDFRQRVIVCAAMRDTKTGKVICSVRHWDELVRHHFDHKQQAIEFDDEQGFVDNKYQFLNRTDAWKVAEAAGQIKRRCGGDTADGGTLYSENLY